MPIIEVSNFLGKTLGSYKSKIKTSDVDIESFLGGLNPFEAIKTISEISKYLYDESISSAPSGDSVVTVEQLHSAVLKVLQYSDRNSDKELSSKDLLGLIEYCQAEINEEPIPEGLDSNMLLMYSSYRQFQYQDIRLNEVARTLYIYKEVWYNCDMSKDLDVLLDIESSIGLTLDKIVLFVFLISYQKGGFFVRYTDKALSEIVDRNGIALTGADFNKFLTWSSKEVDFYRTQHDSEIALLKYPIIDSKWIPPNCESEVFMIASYHNVWRKLSQGIYYALCDYHNKGGKKNAFKERFGHAFEAYVGILLSEHLQSWTVKESIKFGKSQDETIDWFVRKGNKLILIEVKQSSIFFNAKNSKDIELYKDDLNKTVFKAVKQLKSTKSMIQDQSIDELKEYFDVEEFELVVVLNDPLYNANSCMAWIVEEELGVKTNDYHIININDLERILDQQLHGETFFDDLQFKNKDENFSHYDFKEFVIERYSNDSELSFLKAKYDEHLPIVRSDSNESPSN